MKKSPATAQTCRTDAAGGGMLCVALFRAAENGHLVAGEKHGSGRGFRAFAAHDSLVKGDEGRADAVLRVLCDPVGQLGNRRLTAPDCGSDLRLGHACSAQVSDEFCPVHAKL
jgi:hypothetical protein